MFNPTAEFAIPNKTLTNKSNAEIETQPLAADMNLRKC